MSEIFKPGQIINDGNLQVIDQLATGGMGEVYRVAATIEGKATTLILKCFNSRNLETDGLEAIEMVHRESTAVSKIRHQHIVHIHSVHMEGRSPYLVEEYLPHGDLAQLISSRKQTQADSSSVLDPKDIALIGFQVSSALVMLHQNSIFHGDLKPQNLCMRNLDPPEAVLVDFGHAGLSEGNLLNRNENLATLLYMPPERTGFVKLAGSATSDLYSLGMILYECAVGVPPLQSKDGRDLVNRLLFEVPPPLHELIPDFPVVLSDIISKLIRKNPEDRYHSAFGLAADLERCWQELNQNKKLEYFALATKDKLRELNYRIPMVGRRRELAELNQSLDRALSGGQSLTLIGAPSGSGKSRLAFEVLHKAKINSCYISFVKFSEYERNLPLSAVNLLLAEHCHYLQGLPQSRLIPWKNKVREQLGKRIHLIVNRYESYRPLLTQAGDPEYSASDSSFESFNETLGEFLGLLGVGNASHLLFIDDMQWGDAQSLQVLSVLKQRILDKACTGVMFLGTFRSDEVNNEHMLFPTFLADSTPSTLLQLGPLERSEADSLVELLLDEQGPEVKKLQDACFGFTAGNPFFIYEYLKSAISTGIYELDESSQSWRFHEDRLGASNLSSGVAGLVVERIRGLNHLQQMLVSISSIAGHAMRRTDLMSLIPHLATMRSWNNDETLTRDLVQAVELAYQELLQKNILTPDELSFAFFHDKVQESSYSLLSDEERRVLHHEFGLLCMSRMQNSASNHRDSDIFEASYHICRGQKKDLDPEVRQFLLQAAKSANRVFAYDKAKEYLNTLVKALDRQDFEKSMEKFSALELLADVLSISEQVADAMQIYDQLLTFDCDPIKRAHIYAKKVEFCLNLFDYKNARIAAEAALRVMGERIFTSELVAYVYIFFTTPFLVAYYLWFHFFGRQVKEIATEEEEIRLLLLLKSEISLYFTQPIVAIANLYPLTFKLLRYKDSRYRSTMICYWGIATAAFGFTSVPRRCFQLAYDYFDRTSNPVDKGFVLFVWGFVLDLPRGYLGAAQKKLEEAVFSLAPLGESFWRSISGLGLVLLDYFGAESGQAGTRIHEVMELWKKVGYAATPLGAFLRYHLETENEEQAQYTIEKVDEADKHIQSQGYDSIDSVFACLGIAEYFCYLERYDQAEEYGKRAFRIATNRVHRVTYSLFPAIIYARILIFQKKRWRAFGVLLIAWINQLLRVRAFRPQTCYETGRWFLLMGWKRLAHVAIQSGIRYAYRKGWRTPAAEGKMLLAEQLRESDPILAKAYYTMAKEYFTARHWKFHADEAERGLQKLMEMPDSLSLYSRVNNGRSMVTQSAMQAHGIRQQVEVQTLLDILLKLSAITDPDKLFKALLESLCQATGSELAILYLREDSDWTMQASHNVELKKGPHFQSKVDQNFIHKELKAQPSVPVVRLPMHSPQTRVTTTGSALLLPMVSKGEVTGYCYLANTQIYDLFDSRSLEIAQPIANQGSIALDNIRLNQQLAVERDEIAKLHQTLEIRIIEQTRDIKSIMKHIKLGICTVSGDRVAINKDYSAYLEDILACHDLENSPLIPLLFRNVSISVDEIDQASQSLFATLGESRFGFDVNSHLLPRSLIRGTGQQASILELDWIPICNDEDRVERILVTLNDVTELRSLQEKANRSSEEIQIIGEILGRSEAQWFQFISNSRTLLTKACAIISNEANDLERLKAVFIQVHTLKGNARAMGFRILNSKIHGIEQSFAAHLRGSVTDFDWDVVAREVGEIEELVEHYDELARERLGRTVRDQEAISVPRNQILQIYDILQRNPSETFEAALAIIKSVIFSNLADLLGQLEEEIGTLANELGKEPPVFEMDLPNVRFNQKVEDQLRNILVHMLRNSLDHGLQTATERLARKLPERGCIRISGYQNGNALELIVEDDGRGLNLEKLKELGLKRHLLMPEDTNDPYKIADLIYHPDLSTAEKVTDISGRGIGMSAVKQSIEELGGSLRIEFHDDRPVDPGFVAFAFHVRLPFQLFQLDRFDQQAA